MSHWFYICRVQFDYSILLLFNDIIRKWYSSREYPNINFAYQADGTPGSSQISGRLNIVPVVEDETFDLIPNVVPVVETERFDLVAEKPSIIVRSTSRMAS